MILSDTNLGKFYNITRQTVGTYRKSKNKRHLYNAMKEYYIRNEVLKDGDSSCFEHQVSEVLLKNNKDKK